MKFLFDLFPIILFFVAFKVWGIFTATAVAIVATLVQIAWVAFRHRKVDPMLWVSLGVVTVFGGATLVLQTTPSSSGSPPCCTGLSPSC